MNNKYQTYAHKVLNHFLRNTATVPSVTIEVALYTVTPTATTAGTEVAGTAYARTPAVFGAPAAGATDNSGPVAFPTAGAGGWGIVNGVGIWDVDHSALLYFGDLTAPKTVDAGDTVTFATHALQVTET